MNIPNFAMTPDIQLHHGVHQIKLVPKSVRKHRFMVKRVAVIILLGLGIGIGIGIGFAASNTPAADEDHGNETGVEDDVSDWIQRQISAVNIRNNLRRLASEPHVAGTSADLEGAKTLRDTWVNQGLDTVNIKLVQGRLASEPHVAGTSADLEGAKTLRDTWVNQGLDTVNIKPYKVLLSYPSTDKGKENKVQILNPRSRMIDFTSAVREDTFGEEDLEQKGNLPPYNAYSAAGDVQGDMVYVNYCSLTDLHYLTTYMYPPINLTGKILIARYGAISRSRKVLNAQHFGAAALVLYVDPAKHHLNGRAPGKAYPHGPWLPPTAVQRGSIHVDAGDPLTPHYPATEHAHRIGVNDTRLPRIPVHPISYNDASFIIGNLRYRTEMPRNWTGKLNISYGIGPGFKEPYKDSKGRVVVHLVRQLRWTYNVIGFIRGADEPDRYVLVGNHRDAWGLGAVDPTSGSASLIEITRVFGKLKMKGWRPRRTLVFCSWGAEEFGLIGSVEWTEEYYHILAQRAVTYINLDIAVAGNYVLSAGASPHLIPVIFEATHKVADPKPEQHRWTIYDTMKTRRQDAFYPEPWIPLLRQRSSDFYGFLQGVGVPCINLYYDTEGEDKLYSLYHTSYETFRLVEEYIDPDFRYHQAISRVVAEMLLSVADRPILPFDLTRYTEEILLMWVSLKRHPWSEDILEAEIPLGELLSAILNYTRQANDFTERLANVNMDSPLNIRSVNDQMMMLERAFMMPTEHLPGQPLHRHVLLSPQSSAYNRNYPRTFPGLVDTMVKALNKPTSDKAWSDVAKHVSVLTYIIQSATNTLKDFTSWS